MLNEQSIFLVLYVLNIWDCTFTADFDGRKYVFVLLNFDTIIKSEV